MATTREPTPKWLLGVLFLGIALIAILPPAFIVGGLQEKAKAEPVAHGITTTGTIVGSEVNDVGLHGSITYDPTISFTDRGGNVHLFSAPSVDDDPRKGTKVRVSYDPSNPGHATDLSIGSGRWKAFFFTGLGLTILEVALIVWLLVRRLRRRPAAA